MRLRKLVAVPLACLVCDTVLAGQEAVEPAPRTVHALPLGSGDEIVLDGVLSEAIWRKAVPAMDFRQQEPDEGAASTEATEVRLVFDRDDLYLGVTLFDSEPDRVIAFQKERDTWIGSDDRFMWVLDTYRDGRTAFYFEINPAGLMGDGLVRVGSGDSLNQSWDGIWEARVVRGDMGWTAEVRIPFRTLGFDPNELVWGINFQRTIRRKNEETLWSGHGLNQGLLLPINAGRLTGLEELSQGIGLQITPYAAGHYRDVESDSGSPGDVGVDLSYNVTPNVRAALTINTDFAEVEVDDRQVNLTRFPLVFPERRDFFLEDVLLTRNLRLTPVDVRLNSGDQFRVQWSNSFERLDDSFEISDGVVLPIGDYDFNEVRLEFQSANHRTVTTDSFVWRGGFWSGTRTGFEARLAYRPLAGLEFSSSWETNWIDLPEGKFTTERIQLQNNWAMSPWSSLTAILQYDNVSSVLGLYARFRWIVKPGSDLYLVYTHNWIDELGRFSTLERTATTKVNYTHRF